MPQEITDANLLQLLRDVPAYRKIGGELIRERLELRELIALAGEQGRTDKESRLKQLYDENLILYSKWVHWDNRLDWIEGQLAKYGINVDFGGGLGVPVVIPVVVGGAISATLIGIAAVTTNYMHHRNALKGVKEGWLTPEQAEQITRSIRGPFAGLAGVGTAVALGAAVFFLAPMLRR